MTSAALNKKYDLLMERKAKLDDEFIALQQAACVNGTCDHSRSYEYGVENDNGYGRFWKVPHMWCYLCAQKFYRYGDTDKWRLCAPD